MNNEQQAPITSNIMQGKKGLIMGVANDKSIAWGIAKALHQHGAECAFSYQGEALLKRVTPLAAEVNSDIIIPCDVSDDASIDAMVAEIAEKWGKIDFFVHAIAFADKAELKGAYMDTSRENFLKSMDISCYSLTTLTRKLCPYMNAGGSIITLSYFGAEKVMPHYNVMGVAKAALEASIGYLATDLGQFNIRINAISAGPIKTLAASGIGDFRFIMHWNGLNAPLKRNVTIEEVGNAGLYLLSPLSSGVTAEVLHVDAGYNIVGMVAEDNMEQSSALLHDLGINP